MRGFLGGRVLSIIEKITKISTVMDNLLDFVAQNEFISKDFEEFLRINNIEIQSDAHLNKILLFYILDSNTQDGTRVLDYYAKKLENEDCLLNSLKNNYSSIFQIKKVHKNSYDTYCITNERDMELIPLVKTTALRTIGVKDYIICRIIEYMGEFYLLEIDDVVSSNDNEYAQAQGVKFLVKNPEKIHFQNEEKLKEFKEIVEIMTKSFKKCMGSGLVVTSNKLADDLLEYFNNYHHNLLKNEVLEPLIKTGGKFTYFNVEEYKDANTINDEYLDNAAGGFSNHNCIYDVGFWVDDELGIFIIPFLGTFFEIFKAKNEIDRNKITNWKTCIADFLTSTKVPPSVLLEANNKYKNFVELVNLAFENENFKNIDEIISKFKKEYLNTVKFSSTIVLYNSKVFIELLDYLQNNKNEEETHKTVGRNDLCPCGSGKKYKKCCLK